MEALIRDPFTPDGGPCIMGSMGGILLSTVYILGFMGGILGPMERILGFPLALTYLSEIGASRRLAKIE